MQARAERLVRARHRARRARAAATAIASTARLRCPTPPRAVNPDDVHGPSEVVDPRAFDWDDERWRGRPWHEAVIYELHVGTFTPEGTFAGVEQAARPSGRARRHRASSSCRSPIFPASATGATTACCRSRRTPPTARPEELKSLIAAAHARGIAVMLDVVYNHFGPEGNYLHLYAPHFFTDAPSHAVGRGDQLRRPTARDGARLLHAQRALLARGVSLRRPAPRCRPRHRRRQRAALPDRDRARRCAPGPARARPVIWCSRTTPTRRAIWAAAARRDTFDAQWNDDVHHCLHVLLTGETDGYYADYAEQPARAAVPRSGAGLRLPGRGLGPPGGQRAASPAPICRRPPSSPSCRTTTRSATAPSASA